MAHIHSHIHCLPSENSKGPPLIIMLSAAKNGRHIADISECIFFNEIFTQIQILPLMTRAMLWLLC